jgi:hypothetical protein
MSYQRWFGGRLAAALAVSASCAGGAKGPGSDDLDPAGGETDDVDTDAVDTDPIDTDAVDTDAVDTDPIDTDAVDTDAVDTDPVDTDLVDTDLGLPDTAVVHGGPGDSGVIDSAIDTGAAAPPDPLLALCATPVSYTPDTDDGPLRLVTSCFPVPAGVDCPDVAAPLPWPELNRSCVTSRVVCVASFDGRYEDIVDTSSWETGLPGVGSASHDRCCYTYVGPAALYDCGRPYAPDGTARRAPVVAGAGWSAAGPRLVHLDAQVQAAAVARWTADAAAEHASIAAFAQLSLELLAVGAPADLVGAAQRALADEVAHARCAFTIASRLAGATLGPAALEVASASRGWCALAVAAAVEGGLGESLAAAVAAARLAVAEDPDVVAHLTRVVEDEARHAALAWAIVDEAVAREGAAVREAVDAALAEAVAAALASEPPDEPRWPASGLCGSDAVRRARRAVLLGVFAQRPEGWSGRVAA